MANKSATWKDYLISIDEKNAVKVFKSGVPCDKAMSALREIAQDAHFDIDPKWNTQQTGAKLVKFINETLSSSPDSIKEDVSKQAKQPEEKPIEEPSVSKPETQETVKPATPVEEKPTIQSEANSTPEKKAEPKKSTPKKVTPAQIIQINKVESTSPESDVSNELFFGRGKGLHNTDNPREVLKLLTVSPFNLPLGIDELARNVKAQQLEGVMTSYNVVFYHFKTTPTETAGLVYKAVPNGPKSYKNYRYHELDGLKIPVTDSLDSKKKSASLDIVLDGTIETFPCEAFQSCPSCGGNGKCDNCRGKGETTCYTCNGTGKCEDCRGKGKVDCYYCNGTGQCSHCNGTGYDGTCRKCKGTGTIQIENGRTSDGRKKYKTVRCGNCDGKGMLKCTWCNGSKKCSHCYGKGLEECSTCNGSGRCQTCNGTKKATCQVCNGRGDCVTCDGGGKVTCPRCNGSGNYQDYDVLSIRAIRKADTFFSYEAESKMNKFTKESIKPGKNDLILSWKHENDDVKESQDFCSKKVVAELTESLKKKGYHTSTVLSDMVSKTLLETEKAQWEQNKLYTKSLELETYGFPISKYEFDFENEHYTFYIVGANTKELMGDQPKQHFFECVQAKKGGFFALKKSVTGLFKSEETKLFDRQVALVVLATWLAKKTGYLKADELLSSFKIEDALGHDNNKVQKMMEAVNKEYTDKELYKVISCLEESLSAVVWAYIFSGGAPISKEIGSHLRKDASGYDFLDKKVKPDDWVKISPAQLLDAFSKQYIPNNFQ